MTLLQLLIELGHGQLAAELPSRLILMPISTIRQLLQAIEARE